MRLTAAALRLLGPVPCGAYALAGSAWAQDLPPTDPRPPATQGPPSSQGRPNTQATNPRSPLEPTGFPGLEEKDERLPEAQEGAQELRIISSGRYNSVGQLIKLSGGAHLQYKGYDIFAREIEGDRRTNIFTLRGGAQLIGKDTVVVGETIIVNFDERSFRALKSASEVRPGFLQGRTLDNVYLNGEETWGSQREIFGMDTKFTTCNYDDPHYELDAGSFDLRPNKRIILRKVTLEILHHRLFTIPYISIPLDTRREGYTPVVGHTPQEGYFIKTKWGIPVRGDNDLDAYVDYFEKLGLGLGGRFRYFDSRGEGYLRAYGISGNSDTVEVQQGHRQLFGPNLVQIENNYQQRNYLNAPQNTLLTTRISVDMPQPGRNRTRLNYYRTNNQSSTFESTSQTISLADTRTLWNSLRTQLDVAWVKSESKFSSGGSERQQVDVRFRGQQDIRAAEAELEYQRSIPVGETTNFFSASDRTPVLTLRTDANRLFHRNARLFNAELSIGEFVDPRERDKVSRTNFDIRSHYDSPSQRRFQFGLDGRFKQSMYSDDTAQYAVGYGAQARYSLGLDTALNFRYNYLEREGFTPLAIDRIGKTNLATADLSYRPIRTLKLGLQTGYDFLQEERGAQTAWQVVGLLADWQPRDWFVMRAWPVYDPFSQAWSSVRLDMMYFPGDTRVTVGAKYDGLRKVWGQVNAQIDGLKWGRAKLSTIFSYNGYLKRFDERHFAVTYDLHCAEAILQVRESKLGFRAGREIAFFIRLKAFPFDTPFGLSRRGAPIGTATGRGN